MKRDRELKKRDDIEAELIRNCVFGFVLCARVKNIRVCPIFLSGLMDHWVGSNIKKVLISPGECMGSPGGETAHDPKPFFTLLGKLDMVDIYTNHQLVKGLLRKEQKERLLEKQVTTFNLN